MNNFNDFSIIDGNCSNFTIGHFNNVFSRSNNDFLIMNFNIQCFDRKIDEFSAFLDKISIIPDIIVLTETWFAPSTCRELPGYNDYHCTRQNINDRGGVSIYILQSLNVSCIHYSSKVTPELEHVHVTLKPINANRKNIDIIGIYRPPYRPLVDIFFRSFESIMSNLGVNNYQILMGDFNICGLSPSPVLDNYLDLMRSYAFMPHINIITRPNPHGSDSCLDHIWTNFGFKFRSGVFHEIIISDHLIDFVFLPVDISTSNTKINFRDHSEANILKMIDRLTNFKLFFPLLSATLDLDSKFNLFYDELDRIYKTCCPVKTKIISSNRIKKPWLSNQLLDDIQLKYDLFKRYKNGSVNYDQFLSYKKELQRKIQTAKNHYFIAKFENYNGDSPKTWKLTNNILGKTFKPKKPTSLIHEGAEITDETRLCNIFNEYFANIGQNLANNIQNDGVNPLNYLGDACLNSFSFMATTPPEVHNIINKLKNKKGSLNNVPIFILKKISHVISPLLADIFNHSIDSGIFPDKLKMGRVVPLYKDGPISNVSNYRPITTL